MRKISLILASSMMMVTLILAGCSSKPQQQQEKELLAYPAEPDKPRFYFERTIMSSLNIEYETEDNRFQRFLTGTGKVGNNMVKPYDIAVHKGRIFVSDPPKRTVHIFDPHEFYYAKVGADDDNDVIIQKPFGIDVDDEGNLYLMDQTAGNIKIYTRDGKFLRQFGNKKAFSMPTGLAVNSDGSRIYVSDTGGVSSDKHHVLEFDAVTGAMLQTIGSRGKGDVEFNLPKDIAVDDNNHLYVVDSGNFRIQVVDLADNSLIRSFGKIGRRAGQFSRPKGIALDHDGNIYVSDAAFGNFQIFNSQGQLLMFVGSRSNKLAPGKFMLNSGIAVDEDGRVLMADQFHRKFDIFRPAALDEEQGYLGLINDLTDEKYNAIKAKAKLDAKAKGEPKDAAVNAEVKDVKAKGEDKDKAVENKK